MPKVGPKPVPFWDRVKKTDTCWIWQGAIRHNGYGHYSKNMKSILAHRYAYESVHGKIQEGLQVDHLCRNRACVNPDHLQLVTPQENVLRGVGIAAQNAKKTHCIHGHPFSETNTYWRHGKRGCRICRRNAQNKYTLKIREVCFA